MSKHFTSFNTNMIRKSSNRKSKFWDILTHFLFKKTRFLYGKYPEEKKRVFQPCEWMKVNFPGKEKNKNMAKILS